MKQKKSRGVEILKQRYGMMFVSPWVFGVIVFVLVPVINTLIYSLSDVYLTENGLAWNFVGFKHYDYLINTHATFLKNLPGYVTSGFVSIPMKIALSLILAIILNQKFRGRLLARGVFFLPVLIASGVVMSCISMATDGEMRTGMHTGTNYMEAIDFKAILASLNLPEDVNNLMMNLLNSTFNLIWDCGVQTLLFVSGLQTVPAQLYEVSRVEGATAWENFWFVTMPMLGRIIQLVLFYCMVETYCKNNSVINTAITNLSEKQAYDIGSAMLWFWFALIGVVMALILVLYDRLLLRRWE